MSTLKVNAIRHSAGTSDAITIASDGSCTANITNNLSNRNLIVNGAMGIAQRGTSSTSSGYQTVDRFQVAPAGLDEAATQSQVDVASGTTPYSLGFRKAFRVTNGNQTNGADAGDNLRIIYKVEAQDLVNSGWNYTDPNSFITLSFWVKSSVAQNFYVQFRTRDNPEYSFVLETGSLTGNNWTKVTKAIPGNSNLVFANDNGVGTEINFWQFAGTNYTGSTTLDQWAAYSSSVRTPDYASTWFTTNDATFEITGVQLEVGSHASDFEHRLFSDELKRCQRYYFVYASAEGGTNAYQLTNIHGYSTGQIETTIDYSSANLRAIPVLKQGTGTDWYNAVNASSDIRFDGFNFYQPTKTQALLYQGTLSNNSPSTGAAYRCQFANSGAYIHLDAEL